MRLLRRLLWSLLVLALLGTSGLVCSRVAERGRYAGAFSSYGAGPDGARALYLLSERLGARPQRWAQDLAGLPPPPGLLLALGSCRAGMARELSRYEQAELTRWVEAGGTLLVAGARHYLPDALRVGFEPEPGCRKGYRFLEMQGGDSRPDDSAGQDEATDGQSGPEDPAAEPNEDGATDATTDATVESDVDPELDPKRRADPESAMPAAESDSGAGPESNTELVWAVPEGTLLSGLDWVPLADPGRISVHDDTEHDVILSLDDAPDMPQSTVRREAAIVVPRGDGHVVVIASASPLQNRNLLQAEGGVLFSRVLAAHAPHGPVLFDEYHLGVGERRSMMRYLRQAGLGPVALQVFFVVGLLLLRAGSRFGSIRRPAAPPPEGTTSYVTGMGNLFTRADDARGALQILVRQALSRIAAHHHVAPSAEAPLLARGLRHRGLSGAADAVREIDVLSHEHAAAVSADLPSLSQKLDALVAQAAAPDADHGASPDGRDGDRLGGGPQPHERRPGNGQDGADLG